MKYTLNIPQHNIRPHLDIEKDIQEQKNGILTFNLRINQGNIEDYARFETITASKYQGITITFIEECIITPDPLNRG